MSERGGNNMIAPRGNEHKDENFQHYAGWTRSRKKYKDDNGFPQLEVCKRRKR